MSSLKIWWKPPCNKLLCILAIFDEQGGDYGQGRQQVLECGRGPRIAAA